jgi:hypothetical protein
MQIPVRSRYWHGQASLVEAVVRHAWPCRCAHASQHVCDGVRVLRTPRACCEAFAGKCGTMVDVLACPALLLRAGANPRHQTSPAGRQARAEALSPWSQERRWHLKL